MNDFNLTEVRRSLKSLTLNYIAILCALVFIIFSNQIAVILDTWLAGFGLEVSLAGDLRILAVITTVVSVYGLLLLPVLGRRYEITQRQVREVRGVFFRTLRDIRLERVYGIRIEASLLGRVFGYGDVVLECGDRGCERIAIRGVDAPECIAQMVSHYIDAERMRRSGQQALSSASSLVNELIEEVREMQIARIELQTRIEAYLDRREQLDMLQNEVLQGLASQSDQPPPVISEVVSPYGGSKERPSSQSRAEF